MNLPSFEQAGFTLPSTPRPQPCLWADFHMTIALGSVNVLWKQQKTTSSFSFSLEERGSRQHAHVWRWCLWWLVAWPSLWTSCSSRLKVGQIGNMLIHSLRVLAKSRFAFRVRGHAAFPHEANDALVAASYFATQVQSVVSRNIWSIEELSSLGATQLVQPIMSSAGTAFTTWNHSSIHTAWVLLVQKTCQSHPLKVWQSCFDMEVEVELSREAIYQSEITLN